MAKRYTRKQVSSLKDLDREQERIRYKVRRIEDDWMDIFQPQQLVLNLAMGLLGRRKKKAAAMQAPPGKGSKKGKRHSGLSMLAAGLPLQGKQAGKKILKKIGISFLQWQVFNLALYLGRKAWKHYKERKLRRHSLA